MPGEKYGILLQPQFENGGRKTLGGSFHTNNTPNMDALRNHFEPIIASEEEDYNEAFCIDTRIKIVNLTDVNSSKAPKTRSSQTNVILQTMQQTMQQQAQQTNSIITAMQQQTQAILTAIQSQSQQSPVNWTPLIQAVATAVPAMVGVPVQLATTTATPTATATPTPTPTQIPAVSTATPTSAVNASKDLLTQAQVEALIQRQAPQQTSRQVDEMQELKSLIKNMKQELLVQRQEAQRQQEQFQTQLQAMQSTIFQLSQGFNTLSQIVAATTGSHSNGSNGSNGSSTPVSSTPVTPSDSSPAAPAASAAPTPSTDPAPQPITGNCNQMVDDIQTAKKVGVRKLHTTPPALESPPEITPAEPFKKDLDLSKIVTADLESLITKDGHNLVYMAAWHNGKESSIFDITSYHLNTNAMLQAFWLDLINRNKGRTLYFHNWAGYDAILSLLPLLILNEHGFTYTPIMQNGQLISLTILQRIKDRNTIVLTIKDSLKLIPGALAKLAKEFKVETQKYHFPHYFLLDGEIDKTLNYVGTLPEYQFFEPKRTTPADYAEMIK